MNKLILLILILFLTFSCTEINRTDKLLSKVDSLKINNDSLNKVLDQIKSKPNYWYNVKYDGKKLIESGINNPVEFIENSLREKTELIPLKAVLGGTMYFGNIQLLSSEWLIVDYADGHIQGRAIFKYKLNKKGELEFELLNAIGPE